jgi:hypothetical protein
MIIVYGEIIDNIAVKLMACPTCGYSRAFTVPKSAMVRRSRRGRLPELTGDIILIKCKNCRQMVGLTTEKE